MINLKPELFSRIWCFSQLRDIPISLIQFIFVITKLMFIFLIYLTWPNVYRVAGNAGANTLALAESLGLAEQVRSVAYGHPSTKNRMIQVRRWFPCVRGYSLWNLESIDREFSSMVVLGLWLVELDALNSQIWIVGPFVYML